MHRRRWTTTQCDDGRSKEKWKPIHEELYVRWELAPTDFHLFEHLNGFLKENNFSNEADVENAFNCFIAPRNSDSLRNGIIALVYR